VTTERVIEAVGVQKHYKGGTEGAGLNGFDLEVTAGTPSRDDRSGRWGLT